MPFFLTLFSVWRCVYVKSLERMMPSCLRMFLYLNNVNLSSGFLIFTIITVCMHIVVRYILPDHVNTIVFNYGCINRTLFLLRISGIPAPTSIRFK